MCNSKNCKACGNNIAMAIEFGTAVAISHEGDGYVCDRACKQKYDGNQLAQRNALADPATNLCAFLGVPQWLNVGENAAFS